MRKIVLILILLIINVIAFSYLKETIYEKKAYELKLNHHVFVIPKKSLLFEDINDFKVDDYFYIYSFNDYDFRYYFSDNNLILKIDDLSMKYPYQIKEKEVEIIETVVVKEVYIKEDTSVSQPANNNEDNYVQDDDDYEDLYFELDRDHFNYDRGSSISSIIADIQSSIHTNSRVTLDYSALNPNDSGEYPVILMTESNSYTIYVQIV
jgi:hypothetical protein